MTGIIYPHVIVNADSINSFKNLKYYCDRQFIVVILLINIIFVIDRVFTGILPSIL